MDDYHIENASYKWILNKLLYLHLNNILLYENDWTEDRDIHQNANKKKKSHCKVCFCAEKGSGYVCAPVMPFKTTWWKILIRTHSRCNQKSQNKNKKREK